MVGGEKGGRGGKGHTMLAHDEEKNIGYNSRLAMR